MLGDANHVAGMQGLGALCLPAGAPVGNGAHAVAEGVCHGGAATDQAGTVCLGRSLPISLSLITRRTKTSNNRLVTAKRVSSQAVSSSSPRNLRLPTSKAAMPKKITTSPETANSAITKASPAIIQ